MSFGGGGTNTTYQVQSSDPWSGAQPYMSNALQEGNNLYYYGVGNQIYPYSQVAPLNTYQVEALDATYNTALQGQPFLNDVMNTGNYIVNQQGVTAPMYAAMQPAMAAANGEMLIGTGPMYQGVYDAAGQQSASGANLQGIASGAQGPSYSEQYLTPMANGTYVGYTHPALVEALGYSANQAQNAVNSTYAGLGRYGSANHDSAVAREVGNLYSNALYNDYQAALGRQLQAAGQMDSARAQNLGLQINAAGQIDSANNAFLNTQLGAAQGLTNVEAQNIANQINSGLQVANIYGQGLDRTYQWGALYPTLYNQQYADEAQMAGVGDVWNQYQQNLINADVANWQQAQSQPWQTLQNYNSMATGSGGTGSSTSGSTTRPGATTAQSVIGGAATGAGLASLLGLSGPAGWAAAGLGGLAGLL